MKIFILADEPNWIINRVTDKIIAGIPSFEFTKRYHLGNSCYSISHEEFMDLGSQNDLIHFQNWGVFYHEEGLKKLGHKTLLSVRSFRYPQDMFPKWSIIVKKIHVIHPDLIKLIPNSVYIPNGISEQFRPDHEFTVGFAGVQGDYKGFPLIKQACIELGVKFKPAWGIQPKDMLAYYNSIDLYVCASIAEGMSTPVMECLSMNKPVLTTNVGIPRLLNVHTCERSIESIKNGIEKFCTYPQVRGYTWENICLQFKKLYEELVKGTK